MFSAVPIFTFTHLNNDALIFGVLTPFLSTALFTIWWRSVFIGGGSRVRGENHRPSIGKLTILVN